MRRPTALAVAVVAVTLTVCTIECAKRFVRVLMAMLIAGAGALLVAAPATADDPRVWHRCGDRALTWTVAIPPSVKGVRLVTERRFISAALARVTAATKGRYQFRYQPAANVTIAWGTTGYGTAYEQVATPFRTSPEADLVFAVLPSRTPTPGAAPSYDLRGRTWVSARQYDPVDIPSPTLVEWYTRATNIFDAKKWPLSTVGARRAGYMQAALTAMGVDGARTAADISTKDKAALDSLATLSCRNVERWPDVVPTPMN